MIWSRMKKRAFHPSPRAGCCGVLFGTKWYIAGGGSRKKRIVCSLSLLLFVSHNIEILKPTNEQVCNAVILDLIDF